MRGPPVQPTRASGSDVGTRFADTDDPVGILLATSLLFRSPAQAGMTFRFVPRRPTSADLLRIALDRVDTVPDAWLPWLPESWTTLAERAEAAESGQGVRRA